MGYRKRPEKYDTIWGRKRLRKLMKLDNQLSRSTFHNNTYIWRLKPNSDEWWAALYKIIRIECKMQKKRHSAYRKTPEKLIRKYYKERKKWRI